MRDILEPTYKRQIEILNYLLVHPEGISINELSKLTNTSESTVIRDLNYFQDSFSTKLEIKKDNLKDIKIKKTSSQKIKYIQSEILNSSLNINLIKQLLIKPFNLVTFYSEILEVSESSIYKSIKEINLILKYYQIEIKSLSRKYFLFAKSEIILRKLLSVFWVETHLFDLKESMKNYDEISYILNDSHFSFQMNNNLIKQYYESFIFISLIREEDNFVLDNTPNSDTIEQIKKSLDFSPFIDKQSFYNRNFYQLVDFLKNDLFKSNSKDQYKYFFDLIIKVYENEIGHQIPISMFIGQLTFFDYNLKKSSYIYKETLAIISKIESILKIDLTSYISLFNYILIIYYPNNIKNYSNKNKYFYVHSQLSLNHANFMLLQLNKYFDNFYKFKIISSEDIQYLKKDSIIITNDYQLKRQNTILVNDYIETKDIDKIINYDI